MISDNTIYGTILQPTPKSVSILSVTNWWIHQCPLSQPLNIVLIESQVLGAHLGSDELAFVFVQPVCFLLACQMDDMETMIVIIG